MHAIFIPYGKRTEVELLLRDMEAQKHILPCTKGEEKKGIYIQGQVRLLPFGVCEYVCPKEDMDVVLHTLDFDKDRYKLGDVKKFILRKMIKCEVIPEYKKEKQFLWIKQNVNIIPIGVIYDGEITDPSGEMQGWTHEAI
jgi:hypothetical protein